jgi:hypothetical protein
VSTAVSAPNVGPREVVFRPVWSADGRGVHANGFLVGPQGGAGTLMLDGTFEVGMHAEFPTGVGPRRTAPDGARIQCLEGEDYGCEDGATISRFSDVDASELFVDDRAEVRIADFAVSADGRSLWVLFESVASGPRTLTLVHRAADGTERVVTTFDAVADDPDENSYFEGGSLAGLAPDDTRIVVRLAGDGGATGARWAIDPASGERVSVDGAPAGWLTRDTLTAPRPAIEAIVETDLALRGSWVTMRPERVGAIPEGYHELTLRRSMGSLDVGFGQRVGLSVRGDGPDGLIVRQERAAIGCAAGSIARYRWSIADAHLRLEASDDDCVARRLLLDRTFEAVLPSGDTNSVPVQAGSTVIASRFAVPFRLTVPAGGLLAQSHSADTVAVSDDPEGRFLTIVPVVAGAADPCDRFTAGAPLEPGLAAAVAYLEGLGDLGATVERQPEVAIGDRPGPTFRLTGPASCEGRFAVFARNGRALTVPDGASVTLVEPRPGAVVAIIVGADPGGDPAWVSALLGSIDFVDEVPTS